MEEPDSPCGATHEDGCKFAEEAARAAANEAVRQTFAIMGVDIDKPENIEEYRKDLRFGGTLRKTAEKGITTFVMVLAGMAAAAFVAGIGLKIKQLMNP